MYDARLRLLQEVGYSKSEVENFVQMFPASFLEDLSEASTPREAKVIAEKHLADSKSSNGG